MTRAWRRCASCWRSTALPRLLPPRRRRRSSHAILQVTARTCSASQAGTSPGPCEPRHCQLHAGIQRVGLQVITQVLPSYGYTVEHAPTAARSCGSARRSSVSRLRLIFLQVFAFIIILLIEVWGNGNLPPTPARAFTDTRGDRHLWHLSINGSLL